MVRVDIYTNFEVIWTKLYFMLNFGLIANLKIFLSFYGSGM